MVKFESFFELSSPYTIICNAASLYKHVLFADAVKDICGYRDNLQCCFIMCFSEFTEIFRRITVQIETFSSNHPSPSYINRVFGRFLSEYLDILFSHLWISWFTSITSKSTSISLQTNFTFLGKPVSDAILH